jgi:hypothetical protein
MTFFFWLSVPFHDVNSLRMLMISLLPCPWRKQARPAVIDALSMADLSGRTGIVSESSPGVFLQVGSPCSAKYICLENNFS